MREREREGEGEGETRVTDLWSYDKVLHALHDVLVSCDDQL